MGGSSDDDLTVEYLTEDDGSATSQVPDDPSAPHRRRGLLLGLLALLVAAGVAGALLVGQSPEPPAVGLPAPGTATRAELDRAGFTGQIGGSLAKDTEAIKQIRERVAALSQRNAHPPTTANDVIVLYAGDIGPGRYAAVLYREPNGWSRAVLTGDARQEVDLLNEGSWLDDDRQNGPQLNGSWATFVNRSGDPRQGAVLVIAPNAASVEVAHARQFRAGGEVTTTWRAIKKQGGMVWAGPADENELYMGDYRAIGSSANRDPSLVDPADHFGAVEAISEGSASGYESGKGVIRCAAEQVRLAGATLAEVPVLARAVGLDAETVAGAVVLRSPDGGWLWGLCDSESRPDKGNGTKQSQYTGSGIAKELWGDADHVMAAILAILSPGDRSGDAPPRFVVLAPAGADQVQIAGVKAQVRGRLAEVTVPWGTDVSLVRVEALRHGRVIGYCTAHD